MEHFAKCHGNHRKDIGKLYLIARASVQFFNFVSDDLLIGDDIDAVREDDKECRF